MRILKWSEIGLRGNHSRFSVGMEGLNGNASRVLV